MQTQQILHLIIYQDIAPFKLMQSYLSSYYKKFHNITSLFIIYDPTLAKDYLLIEDILYIKGAESKIPGILQKTLDALIYKQEFIHNFTYIIRSNISSVVNLKLLQNILLKNSDTTIHYLGGYVHTAEALAPQDGLVESRDLGLQFASGTLIVFSPLLASSLLLKRHYLRYNMVDDLAIAVFVRDFFNETIYSISPNLFYWNDQSISLELRLKLIDQRQDVMPPILWRNKSINRMDDALCVQHICDII
jgi:hypothetical protein